MKLCSTNDGKLAEFGGLLAPLDIRLEPVRHMDIPETGDTFRANAIMKALGYAKHFGGEWVLAEDSGLVVPALNAGHFTGLPGAYSARFADMDLLNGVEQESGRPRSEMDPAISPPVSSTTNMVALMAMTIHKTRL